MSGRAPCPRITKCPCTIQTKAAVWLNLSEGCAITAKGGLTEAAVGLQVGLLLGEIDRRASVLRFLNAIGGLNQVSVSPLPLAVIAAVGMP